MRPKQRRCADCGEVCAYGYCSVCKLERDRQREIRLACAPDVLAIRAAREAAIKARKQKVTP